MNNDDIKFNELKNKINITKNDTYKDIIFKVINILDPEIRKKKYSNEYYFKMMHYLLNNIVNWKDLQIINPNSKPYHYKTIHNKFIKWSYLNVFEYSYKIYNAFNNKKINHKDLDLFIDCSYITNIHGSENVDFNPEYKKKKATKVSVLCNKNKEIISVYCCEKSTIHDVKTINNTLNNIIINTSNKNVNIIGDKGYINSSSYFHKNKKVKIIAPNRKNMKKRSNKYNKQKLKKRYLIENVFCDLKKHNRIRNRKERKIKNYMSFFYIACLTRI